MSVDFDKPLQTRDGRKVRIYARDGKLPYPNHGAVLEPAGWAAEDWTQEGTVYPKEPDRNDLVNVSETHEVWVGIYEDGAYRIAKDRALPPCLPDEVGCGIVDLIARKRITITEGEFDE